MKKMKPKDSGWLKASDIIELTGNTTIIRAKKGFADLLSGAGVYLMARPNMPLRAKMRIKVDTIIYIGLAGGAGAGSCFRKRLKSHFDKAIHYPHRRPIQSSVPDGWKNYLKNHPFDDPLSELVLRFRSFGMASEEKFEAVKREEAECIKAAVYAGNGGIDALPPCNTSRAGRKDALRILEGNLLISQDDSNLTQTSNAEIANPDQLEERKTEWERRLGAYQALDRVIASSCRQISRDFSHGYTGTNGVDRRIWMPGRGPGRKETVVMIKAHKNGKILRLHSRFIEKGQSKLWKLTSRKPQNLWEVEINLGGKPDKTRVSSLMATALKDALQNAKEHKA